MPKHNKGEQRRRTGSSAPVRSRARDPGDPAARAPRRAASSAFVWPGRDPPPPAPFPPDLPPSTPITRRQAVGGFCPSPPPLAIPGSLQTRMGLRRLPPRPGCAGQGWGPGQKRKGHTKRADLTAGPLPQPLQSSLGPAIHGLEKQPSHPAPRRLPLRPPHPPRARPGADDGAGHRPRPVPAPPPREAGGLGGPGSQSPRPHRRLAAVLFARVAASLTRSPLPSPPP